MHEAAAGTTTPPTDVISASSPAEEVSSRRLMVALLGLAILLGVGLRLKHYLARHAYWHDEASLVLNVFEKTALQLLGPLDSAQAAAPGFLLLQRGVHVVLGRSELAMRLAPFLAAIAGIAIFSLLAWRLLPPRVALLLIVLWACSERIIWHAAEAKQYSIDVLVALALLATAVAPNRSAAARLAVCAAIAVVGVWFSHPTAFVFGGLALALLPVMCRRRRDLATWFVCNAAFAISFLALYVISVRDQQVSALYEYWAEGFIDYSRPLMIPIWVVRHLWSISNYTLDLAGPVLLGLALLGGRALCSRGRRELLGVLVIPAILVLVAAALKQYPFAGSRLTLFLAPSVFLLGGFGVVALLDWTRRHPRRQWIAVSVTGYLLAIAMWHAVTYLVRPPIYGDMPAAVQYVAAHDRPGDIIYVNKISEFRCYWPGAGARDAKDLVDEVPDGRFWLVLSYRAGRDGRILPPLLKEVIPEAKQLDAFEVPGGTALLFDGIDGPATRPVISTGS